MASQVCHVGDALAEEAAVSGGFAGIVVDLFAEGQILPALQQVMSVALSALTSSLCTGRAFLHCGVDTFLVCLAPHQASAMRARQQLYCVYAIR